MEMAWGTLVGSKEAEKIKYTLPFQDALLRRQGKSSSSSFPPPLFLEDGWVRTKHVLYVLTEEELVWGGANDTEEREKI